MYKIQIDTKSQKTYIMNCANPSEVKDKVDKNEFLILDMGSKGLFIPCAEIAQILFEKLPDEGSQIGLTTDSQEHYPATTEPAEPYELCNTVVIPTNSNNPA
jgi:hypothetical protein